VESTEILLALLTALVSASWGTTQVHLARIEKQVARTVDRDELVALREEMHGGFRDLRDEMKAGDAALRGEMYRGFTALREEVTAGDASLRTDMNQEIGGLRAEMTAMRSDITQIALAVGAGRPRAEEG
jgi:hypothetical protein